MIALSNLIGVCVGKFETLLEIIVRWLCLGDVVKSNHYSCLHVAFCEITNDFQDVSWDFKVLDPLIKWVAVFSKIPFFLFSFHFTMKFNLKILFAQFPKQNLLFAKISNLYPSGKFRVEIKKVHEQSFSVIQYENFTWGSL